MQNKTVITLEGMVEVLNEALALDHGAIHSLFCATVPVNEAIANHPTIEVGLIPGSNAAFNLRLLGLLNGMVRRSNTSKYIAREHDEETGKLLRFIIMDETEITHV